MSPVKLVDNVFWVGAVDWNIRHFHGHTYSTHRGTTYNAYLIIDDHTALVDTVHRSFTDDMVQKITEITNPSKIDYIIVNHLETDHSGAIPEILKLASQAKLIGTARCKEGLEKHFPGNWDFQIVKTGDTLQLGDRTLTFLEAPMLHWPDSMFTYIQSDALLLPNDAFGQHLATSVRFNDEVDNRVVMEEATKYYANILMPFGDLILNKIDEIQKLGLKVNMIAPSHGIIWRTNPTQIVESYLKWAQGKADKKILVVYDTMWNSTEKMAKAIVEGITSEGVDTMLFCLPFSDRGDILKELLEARAILIGSSTINNSFLPTVAPLLTELIGLKPKNKMAAAFGSFGWGSGAVNAIEKELEKAGIEIFAPPLTVKWVPNKEELQKCFEYGRQVAAKIAHE